MFYVYVLVSLSRNYICVGMTDDLQRRIDYHNNGYNKTTKPYRPFRVLLSEELPTRIQQGFLKSGVGSGERISQNSDSNKKRLNAHVSKPAGRQVVCLRTCLFDSDLRYQNRKRWRVSPVSFINNCYTQVYVVST